ncbi:MAG: hypothetical protein J6B87_02880 [Clostridia bacterium]|nr:hypothetical protein [Clostridia bacterium]
MNNLSFDNGVRELVINGDENRIIRFNPCDYELLKRADGIYNRLDEKFKEIEEKELDTVEKLSQKDKVVREEIDYLLDSKVSDIVFGRTNCLSISNGEYIFSNFLAALMKYIENSMKEEEARSNEIIKQYTEQVGK